MTLIVIGVSHHSAPFDVLDRLALDASGATHVLDTIMASPHVAEAMVLPTCNRVEVYADVDRFHGAVEDVTSTLAKVSGVQVGDLVGHVYVHYDERAAHHLFSVAAGLDSMVLGEQQILGQVRQALRDAQEAGTAGRTMQVLGQTALRVGKRVQSETDVDRHGASVVSVALERAAELLGGLAGVRAAVIGAGAMSSLAATHLGRADVASLAVVNRTEATAERLVGALDGVVPTRLARWDQLDEVLAAADLVVACTGSAQPVIHARDIPADGRLRVLLDLALPHDVDHEVRDIPGVHVVDLASLAGRAATHTQAEADASAIVAEETRAFAAAQAAVSVEPLVVSLRARADGILDREVERLRMRLPGLDDEAASEVERAMRRAMSALLHTPTVRVKELAADPDGRRYAAALGALFDLEPDKPTTMSTAPEPALLVEDGRRG